MKTYSDSGYYGVSFPADTKPSIMRNHIDGPAITFSDGQMHWLTLWERFLLRCGWTDAADIQRKRRPYLTICLRLHARNRR